MNVLDRVRIERAVLGYDWWLDLRGTPWRRRRDLRSELRANLRDAAAHIGARAAVAALMLTLLGAMLAGLAWADGVMSADPSKPASGSVTLLPGSSMEYAPLGDGFAVSAGVGWLPVAVGVLVFVVVSRPWRAVGRYTSTQPPVRQ